MSTGAILTVTLPDGRIWEAPLNDEVVALLLAKSEHLRALPYGAGSDMQRAISHSPAEIAAGELEGMLRRSLLV